MNKFCTIAFLLLSLFVQAQKPCEYSTNVTDSLGVYKSTKEYLIHERNFAGSSSYIFFSLIYTDGTPVLNLQTIDKSSDFIKANCMDANTKLFFQLTNGKIITLIHTPDENCGTLVRVENKDTRINTGSFMFLNDAIADLKSAPVTLMRIKYGAETIDYVFKKEFKSELTNEMYYPENYFINYINCVE